MDIQASNRLIAEFDDWVAGYGGKGSPYYSKESTFVPAICLLENMKYHIDWSWLMPVVEKIESLYDENISVKIFDSRCDIELVTQYAVAHDFHIPTFYEREDSKIKAVYKAVVRFIQWYNQQSAKTL